MVTDADWMDQNEILHKLRIRVNTEFDLFELQVLFNSLDEHLRNGGELPKDWKWRLDGP